MSNPWNDWFKQKCTEKEAEISYLENDYEKLSNEKTLTTNEEYDTIVSLSKCGFLPGSWDKKFVRSLYVLVDGKALIIPAISDKQRYWLKKLVHKYRRQIGR